MAIEKDFFRQVMGRFATGVTIVTTQCQGKISGLTVNAFCSVSLHPPLVLVCIEQNSHSLPIMREGKNFAVNILTQEQKSLSTGFATPSVERFEHFCYAEYRTVATGAPILKDTLAFVDTRIVAEYPGGDHIIFLGQVEAMGIQDHIVFADDSLQEKVSTLSFNHHYTQEESLPLLFYKGQYRQMAEALQKPGVPSAALPTTAHEQTD
ncbi:flavin reductase (DIM6/NTAB) family NADH-FMN oxidoreductase RutF [Thermosporothrix hazakensis]|jgi:flavin reductase (DIM6/NTAB) family NADH-FMN oxidoreductase RutF|uniref:Flavin reductase (DIM6/NTAB) family NADH-FMN oxidoreductase RutF n=2 Tax=Thermosporothrix TaxID=768650 RepID=A0A326UGP3_THEHA|nr:flavin reductase family protein [Thermosporothrix hazakensis]PZW30550.1 flavin reductase (DIM6/NTAB) family NADH-FMN oxidoreductase RutF [Thermosporothrix hazakensis]BBH91265.1 flavin oxidoreductase [Thermosporothrix sp. COM3]GCE49411.1 flavin oxidoreductase [Thermosporothrix hazakensis]